MEIKIMKIRYIQRDNYFRIFKNDDEHKKEEKKGKIKYNYMTLDEFVKNYIETKFALEKGITQIN